MCAASACPLCMEELDITDRNFRPCKCGYQICLGCLHKMRESSAFRCPACRAPYSEANYRYKAVDRAE